MFSISVITIHKTNCIFFIESTNVYPLFAGVKAINKIRIFDYEHPLCFAII